MISQLGSVYPISVSRDVWCVGGVKIPNTLHFQGCDEEELATGLGFVCHILFMVAKYLDVPLRYPMVPMCSRSFIMDNILPTETSDLANKYPLFSKGTERNRFAYAVCMLRRNLEQLLNSQGWDVKGHKHILPNLSTLLSRGKEPAQFIVNQSKSENEKKGTFKGRKSSKSGSRFY